MIQMPYLSLNRSSTPMPYSDGRPILNCCGGSLSTLGNMKRPVAASAATEAAENAPHASPIHCRRLSSGDSSAAARVAAFAGAGVAVFAAAPPAEAADVVLPARSGIGAAGGLGGAGFAAWAAGGVAVAAPTTGALGCSGLVSSAICVPGFGDLAIW